MAPSITIITLDNTSFTPISQVKTKQQQEKQSKTNKQASKQTYKQTNKQTKSGRATN